MILVIDNYDSFTYNLVQYLRELGATYSVAAEVKVIRNDKITLEEAKAMKPDGIVISPGPKRPEDAGVSLELIEKMGPTTPLLGVCLGHQSIGQVFGGDVVSAPELMHGKVSQVHHNEAGLFAGVENPMTATRYHSLVIDRASCPDELEITAWIDDDTIMGVRHRNYPHIQGVQFHPESVLTQAGKQLLSNFLASIGASQRPLN